MVAQCNYTFVFVFFFRNQISLLSTKFSEISFLAFFPDLTFRSLFNGAIQEFYLIFVPMNGSISTLKLAIILSLHHYLRVIRKLKSIHEPLQYFVIVLRGKTSTPFFLFASCLAFFFFSHFISVFFLSKAF